MSATVRRGFVQQIQRRDVVPHLPKCRHAPTQTLLSRAHKSFELSPGQARLQSTNSAAHNEPQIGFRSWLLRGSGIRVSTLLAALLAFGAGATVLGLYEVYTSFTQWPAEVRKDLRAGISAKNQGDHALSERYLARAFQTAMTLPISMLGRDPYLKLSGIAAVLAEVSPGRRAKEVLRSVWEKGGLSSTLSKCPPEDGNQSGTSNGWAAYTLTEEERLRRVAVACQLAELCGNEGGKGEEEEERWLVWAVEEDLRLVGVQHRHDETGYSVNSALRLNGSNESSGTSVVLAELALPPWMRRVDLGAPLAALGAVYARKGNVEYAMPLYLQAISLLLPPNTAIEKVSVEDRCEAAQLMNNLSELIMRRPPSPQIRHQAEAWARQAHGVIHRVQERPLPRRRWLGSNSEHQNDREVCDQVLGVVLFNLGMLREMDGDEVTARSLYQQSLKQCEHVDTREGIMQAKQALRRLNRVAETSTS